MTIIRISTILESDTLVIPELRQLIGRTVEISVTETSQSLIDQWLDHEYHAECEADQSPVPSLSEVRAGLASIQGTMTDDFIAERE